MKLERGLVIDTEFGVGDVVEITNDFVIVDIYHFSSKNGLDLNTGRQSKSLNQVVINLNTQSVFFMPLSVKQISIGDTIRVDDLKDQTVVVISRDWVITKGENGKESACYIDNSMFYLMEEATR